MTVHSGQLGLLTAKIPANDPPREIPNSPVNSAASQPAGPVSRLLLLPLVLGCCLEEIKVNTLVYLFSSKLC